MRCVVLLMIATGCGRVGFGEVDRDAATSPTDTPSLDGPLDVDLVVRFPMDSAVAGNNFVGTVPIYDGTFTGSGVPALVSGVHGGAYNFDGLTSAILPAASAGLLGAPPFTVSVWIRPQSVAPDVTIVAKPYGAGSSADVVLISVPAGTHRVTFESTRDGVTYDYLDSTPAIDVVDGGWHHVAVRWDGTTKRVTVDGATTSSVPVGFMSSAAAVIVGADADGGTSVHPFMGDLDDLRFYRRALTDAELLTLAVP